MLARGGFPYLTNVNSYDLYHLPNTVNEATGEKTVWEDDNCIHMNTRDCLAKFFYGARKDDILIFTLGMPYAITHPKIMVCLVTR